MRVIRFSILITITLSALSFIGCGRGFETNQDQQDFSNYSTDDAGAYQKISRTGYARSIVTDRGETKDVYYTPAGYIEEFEDLKRRKEAVVSQVFTDSIGKVKVKPGADDTVDVDIEVDGKNQSFNLKFDTDTLLTKLTAPKASEDDDESKQYALQAKCLSENCDLLEFNLVKNNTEEAAFIKQIKERELEVKPSLPDDKVNNEPKEVLGAIAKLNRSEVRVFQESTTFVKGPSYSDVSITKGNQSVLEIRADHLETKASTTPATATGTSKPVEARVLGNNFTTGGLMVEVSRNADRADGSGEALLLKIKPKSEVLADVDAPSEPEEEKPPGTVTNSDQTTPPEPESTTTTDDDSAATNDSPDTTTSKDPAKPAKPDQSTPTTVGPFKSTYILAPTIISESTRQSAKGFKKLANTSLIRDRIDYLVENEASGVRRALSYIQPIEHITRKIFQAEDLTPEFAYIKVAESKFIGPGFPIEVTRKQPACLACTAAGPWQILKGTAQNQINKYNLPYNVEDIIETTNPRSLHPEDDRGYYVPSTHMAAKFIRTLNDRYGYDPALVILSYHIGAGSSDKGSGTQGAIDETIKAKERLGLYGKYQIDFMEMLEYDIQTDDFKQHHIDYTIKILAFRTIGQDTKKYGINLDSNIDLSGLDGKLVHNENSLPDFIKPKDLKIIATDSVALAEH